MLSACPAFPPPRLLRLSCPPRLGPLLPSGHYGPSVAPRRTGLPAGTTGWYGNRHASFRGVSHREAYSDHQHAYKMCLCVTLKGCRRSHNTLFLTWANVGTQECTQIGKNNLSASFWVICVHYCAASGCRMRFSSPGQTSSRLTERRILQPASRKGAFCNPPHGRSIHSTISSYQSRVLRDRFWRPAPLALSLSLKEDRLSVLRLTRVHLVRVLPPPRGYSTIL